MPSYPKGYLFSIMDFDLYPTITLLSRSFNALLTPREMFIQVLNRNLNLQRFRVLYVTGNYSAILSRLDRRFEALEIRRGFTVFQLMTIMEEAHHSPIFVEHDHLLYEDAAEMTEYVSLAMREAAKEILAEIFQVRPGEVEEMIQRRLEERSWAAEHMHLPEDGLWSSYRCWADIL